MNSAPNSMGIGEFCGRVKMRPPIRSRASRISTGTPARASFLAAARAEIPAPTITTEECFAIFPRLKTRCSLDPPGCREIGLFGFRNEKHFVEPSCRNLFNNESNRGGGSESERLPALRRYRIHSQVCGLER